MKTFKIGSMKKNRKIGIRMVEIRIWNFELSKTGSFRVVQAPGFTISVLLNEKPKVKA